MSTAPIGGGPTLSTHALDGTAPTTSITNNSGDPTSTSLLPAPNPQVAQLAMGSDLGGQIAALLIESGYSEKKSAHEARQAAEKQQAEHDQEQLDAMQSEADTKMMSGIVGGVATAGQGVCQIGASFNSMNSEPARRWEGFGKLSEAGGKLGTTLLDHSAAMDNIHAKAAEQASERDKRAIDDERDNEKDAKDLINRAIDYYKEYTSAKSDCSKAAIMRA